MFLLVASLVLLVSPPTRTDVPSFSTFSSRPLVAPGAARRWLAAGLEPAGWAVSGPPRPQPLCGCS